MEKKGLYYKGELKAEDWNHAVKELYELNAVPSNFIVCEDHEAWGYSVIDAKGVQHIYELSPEKFYRAFMRLE